MSSRSLSFSALVLFLSAASAAAQNTVSAVVETAPVASVGDAADDIAIWVHPTESELSLVIGTDKQAGLVVYDLAGKQLQFLPDGRMNNVDLRSGFDLGDEDVTLVTCLERSAKRLAIYAVDPVARSLRDVAARDILLGMRVYGCCMYKSAATGETYVFATSEDGDFDQWRLFADATGTKVDAELVRSIDIGSQSEGCVADDENAWVFVGEEDVAIWRYGAEPGAGDARVAVDVAGVTGHLDADIEGLALYAGPNNTGYLVASSQGNDSYVVYERRPPHEYRLTFEIGANAALGIDAVSDTDGIDVTSAKLGNAFPGGLFIAQDGTNTGANQNFKFVPWPDIAELADPPLIGAAPVAAFTSAVVGPDTLHIGFTDQSTGSVTEWAWEFGDGATSTEQDPVHGYSAGGDYTVKLGVQGPGGSDSTESLITVVEPAPVAVFGTAVAGPDSLSIAFTDQSTGVVTDWAWDFGDGASSTEQSPLHRYAAGGDYTVQLTVTGPGGSGSTQSLVTVVEPPPVAAFSAAASAPLEISFTDQSSGAVTDWAWDFGDGATSTEQSPFHAYAAAGDYTVELTVTGPGGSNSTQSIVTVREPAPEAAFAFIASAPDTLEVSFVDQSSGAVTDWAWDFGDGATSTEQNPVHVYAAAGDYTVGLTVTGPGGSSSTQNVVGVQEPAPEAAFVAAVSGLNGLRIAFTDQTTGAVTDWSWDFGDGESSSDQNPVHLYAAAGTYTVRLTATGPGGSSTAQDDLVVDDGTTGGGATGGGGGGGCGTVVDHDGRPGSDPALALSFFLALASLALRRGRSARRAEVDLRT